ncbi:MAG TPA: F0F1 ATP synthase subunit delta, partial [Alphaproteobacteria bacterium]|nr:F0F1 ATP synthase subunit delta [Alphaproteobacteria bacterium]
MLVQIARPYAQALFDLAQGENTLDPVEEGLVAVARLSSESPDFARFLRSPVISAD